MGHEGHTMKRILPDSNYSGNSLNVSDWLTETHDGLETRFLCVYYDRFGFGMSLEQVQQAIAKLDALLTRGEPPESSGEIQIDRSGAEDRCIMIAFRPADNHASRYFDFPEDIARNLLARLREMLGEVDRDGRRCASVKGQPT
jgi:hypothetical protein